jgi:hypothetical protein
MKLAEMPRRRRSLAEFQPFALSSAVVLFVVAATGCGGDGLAEVSGTVTVDGEPAKMGAITFIPVDGASQTAGAKIVDGAYAARVAPGTFKVEVRVSKVVGERKSYQAADAPVKQELAESLPARYNDASELTLDVTPGENRKDYSLSTK